MVGWKSCKILSLMQSYKMLNYFVCFFSFLVNCVALFTVLVLTAIHYSCFLMFIVTHMGHLIAYGIRAHLELLIRLIGKSKWTTFIAIVRPPVYRYVDLVCPLLKSQGRILMCAYVYNQTERDRKTIPYSFMCVVKVAIITAGPPFSVSSDVLKSHYGKVLSCNCMQLHWYITMFMCI